MLALVLQAAVTWTAVGGGSVTKGGLYTAPASGVGTVRVVARVGTAADTARVSLATAAVARSPVAARPAPEPTPPPPPPAAARAPGAGGLPFGMAGQPTSASGGVYTLAVMPQHMGAIRALPELRRRGTRLVLNLTNSGNCAKDPGTKSFRLDRWKECFRRNSYDDPQDRRLITEGGADGTLMAIYILDEPNHPNRWGPRGTVTQETIEEMAAYSKSLFPGVRTVVRAPPEWLAAGGVTYRALDGAWAQYRRSRGPIEDYVRKQADGARALGLCLMLSLNVLDGGTTDPNDPLYSGWDSGRGLVEMSPAEILAYGLPMVRSQPWALGAWEYRKEYLSKPGVQEALDSLGRAAAASASGCTR